VPRTLGPDDLVICSGTMGRAPFPLAVAVAAGAGFAGISAYHEDVAAALADGWTAAALRSLLDDHGVAVAELDGRFAWLPGDEDRGWPSADEFVDTAAAVAARSITVLETRRRRLGEDGELSWDEVAAAYATVCDRAAEHGLLVHIEYFPYSALDSLSAAWEVARRADRPNGGVMVDLWHHVRGPDAGSPALAAPGDRIFAVQVGDVAPVPWDDRRAEMMHGRVLPGRGAGDVPGLLRALREQGCTAPLEVEVYADELTAAGPEEAARRAMAALRQVLSAV
jgi:sugar phosphate isomerase/epimerase